MIKNPYETTIGRMIYSKDLTDVFNKFITTNDITNLGYEYTRTEGVGLVFITGKNEAEKDLPMWTQPYHMVDYRGRELLFVDMRSFLKTMDSEAIYMGDYIRDGAGYEFTLLRAVMTADVLSGNLSIVRKVTDHLVIAFAAWIVDILNSALMLNPLEQIKASTICGQYVLAQMKEGEIRPEDVELMITRLGRLRLGGRLDASIAQSIVEDINVNPTSMKDLTENIKVGVGSPKVSFVDNNMLVNLINTSWYGPNGQENILIGMEHLPTTIAILYSSMDNLTYKKTRLAMLMQNNKRNIDDKEFTKKVSLYLDDMKTV
jgi:hypothetical protein